jgi:hypothetical protein
MSRFLIDHPRRAVLFAVVVLTAIVGSRVALKVFDGGPPGNDQAAFEELRSQFAQSAWEPSLASAYWSGPDDLVVSLNSNDRRLALAACADLTGIVQVRTSTGPGNVTYTTDYGDGILFIENQSKDIMVSNLSNNAGCQWRLG